MEGVLRLSHLKNILLSDLRCECEMSDKKLEDIENEITQLFKKALDSPFFGHDERFPLNELNNIIEKSKA